MLIDEVGVTVAIEIDGGHRDESKTLERILISEAFDQDGAFFTADVLEVGRRFP